MNNEKLIEKVKKEILSKTKPVSLFLYGSYNTENYLAGVSDLEIGVVKVGEVSYSQVLRKIAEKNSSEDVRLRIYPYNLEKLKNGTTDTPFTKSVTIRHFALTAKTIWGERIMEDISLPPITCLDIYREASFSTMRALSGLFFLRAGNEEEAVEMGYKAALFATLSLEYLLGEFPIGFHDIVKLSKQLNLDKKWNGLIEYAFSLRNKEINPSTDELYDFIFKVMSFCNQVVEERVKEAIAERGESSVCIKRTDRCLIP